MSVLSQPHLPWVVLVVSLLVLLIRHQNHLFFSPSPPPPPPPPPSSSSFSSSSSSSSPLSSSSSAYSASEYESSLLRPCSPASSWRSRYFVESSLPTNENAFVIYVKDDEDVQPAVALIASLQRLLRGADIGRNTTEEEQQNEDQNQDDAMKKPSWRRRRGRRKNKDEGEEEEEEEDAWNQHDLVVLCSSPLNIKPINLHLLHAMQVRIVAPIRPLLERASSSASFASFSPLIDQLVEQRWGSLWVWGLTEYARVVKLSSHTLILRNITELFQMPDVAAVPRGYWRGEELFDTEGKPQYQLNNLLIGFSGLHDSVLLLRPELHTLRDLLALASTIQAPLRHPPQQLIYEYFEARSSYFRLPSVYNVRGWGHLDKDLRTRLEFHAKVFSFEESQPWLQPRENATGVQILWWKMLDEGKRTIARQIWGSQESPS